MVAARKRRKRKRIVSPKASKAVKKQLKKVKIEVDVPISREILGIFYFLFAILTIMSLSGSATGPFGEFWLLILSSLIGMWGTYLFIFVFGILGFLVFFFRNVGFNFTRMFGLTVLFFSFLGWVQIEAGIDAMTLTQESIRANGGYLGFVVGYLLQAAFEDAARYVLFALMLMGVVVTFGFTLKELFTLFQFRFNEKSTSDNVSHEDAIRRLLAQQELPLKDRKGKTQKAQIPRDDFKVHTSKVKTVAQDGDMSVIDVALRQKEKKMSEISINTTIDENYKWEFPSVDLLDDAEDEVQYDDSYLRKNAKTIEAKLNQFGISVKVKDVKVGPTVMQYSVQPAEDVKLSKITGLRDDLKLALAAESLRIEAPIPGQSLVGIEIPNEKRTAVRLKELLLSNTFYKVRSNLRLPLGKDVSGTPLIADLASMPHLLLAGQTGSGKSVGINSMIISLLYQNSPRDLRFILIDPKRVELKLYNHIPHLLTPVITEVDKSVNALKWLVAEMMRRYTELESKGARNRDEYNEKVSQEDRMPNIVCVIDELAEMMMSGDKKAIEGYICRIAQLARAVGIHLIIATQRPSVDVITGLIKANIPARVAYRVASSIDSRTVLDMIGAEDLLGRGDMLFIPGNASDPTRVQGVFIPTSEVEKVVNNIKLKPDEMSDVQYVDEIIKPKEGSTLKGSIYGGEASDEDELIDDAIEVLRAEGKASTSLLQRRLKVGYARAARILDALEERGVVGPADGSKPRKVFLSQEEAVSVNVEQE